VAGPAGTKETRCTTQPQAAALNAEVLIVTMVYLARLQESAGLVLQPANWKRVLLGSVMLASKVWDDQVWCGGFSLRNPYPALSSHLMADRV
jgi:hypothetical protein